MVPMSPALAAQIDDLDRLGKIRTEASQVSRTAGDDLAAGHGFRTPDLN